MLLLFNFKSFRYIFGLQIDIKYQLRGPHNLFVEAQFEGKSGIALMALSFVCRESKAAATLVT